MGHEEMKDLQPDPEKFNRQFSIVECVIDQFLDSGNLVKSPNAKAIVSALFSIYSGHQENKE